MHFSIKINAPAHKVWDTMLNPDTYKQWTEGFGPSPGHYEGSWDKGSKIRFLASGENSKLGGMVCEIEENKPQEFVSIRVLGMVVDGQDDTASPEAKAWAGSHENYTFKEQQDGSTDLEVDLESSDQNKEMADMLAKMWPPALEKLKTLAES